MVFNSNNDSLVHLIADNFAHASFSKISFHDISPSVITYCVCLLGDNSLDSCDVLANFLDSACIVKLVGCVLES